MISSCVKSFLALFMVMLFTVAGYAQLPETCDDHNASSSQQSSSFQESSDQQVQTAAHHEHDSSSHSDEQDCHCPFHHTHCCHAQPNLKSTAVAVATPRFFENLYLESLFVMKPGPHLEGPFQPPRA